MNARSHPSEPGRRKWRAMLRRRWARVRSPGHLWWFLLWLAGAVRWRLAARLRRRRKPQVYLVANDVAPQVATRGARARAVFACVPHLAAARGAGEADVVLADTPAQAPTGAHAAVLTTAPPMLSVPALDPRRDNPIGWIRDAEPVVAALGPPTRLPSGVTAHRVADIRDRPALLRVRHVEDVAGFHADVAQRAGRLARLAANGVVVHLADNDQRLRPHLGDELHDLMAAAPGRDAAAREALSIRMRRAALKTHSVASRLRQVRAAAGAPAPSLPLVSILLVTRRPAKLRDALAAVARQTYPNVELMLALHGDGFDDAEALLGALPMPWNAVSIGAGEPLGAALNIATGAASGVLLTKMDDDDLYGPHHVWDLVLAKEYSGAALVGKGLEFVYLAQAKQTLHCLAGGGERWSQTGALAGSALLIAREDLERAGGWRPLPRRVDRALWRDVARAGGRVYRTHGSGYMAVRHGAAHTWRTRDGRFQMQAATVADGWQPAMAGLDEPNAPTL